MKRDRTRIVGVSVLALCLLALGALALGAEFEHGPYSGAPTEDSVFISWLTPATVPARIEFDLRSEFEATGALGQVIEVDPFEPSALYKTTHVELTGLPSDSDFVYRVILTQSDSDTVSPIGAFSTAPDSGEPVTFAVLADTQQQLEGENRLALVCGGIASDPAPFDFILHGGDIVETPSSYFWDDWFLAFGDMLLRASFIPVLGNHEGNHRSYYEQFILPPGDGKRDEQWWVFRWGDVIVVGLDTNANKANEFAAQQEWAREQLSGPEPHKFVIFHHPVFTSDAYHGSGTFLDKIYHPIFVEHEVDIVFNGHSHHYEHVVRDGITYLVVGGGGATPRRTRPDHIQGSDVSVEGHHFYVRVHASSDGISVETISVARELGDGACTTDERTLDSFSLRAASSETAASEKESPVAHAEVAQPEPTDEQPSVPAVEPRHTMLTLVVLAGLAAVAAILLLRK